MMTNKDLDDIEGDCETSGSGRECGGVGNDDARKHVLTPVS